MKDLKAFINKDVIKRMKHNNSLTSSSVYIVWYGHRNYDDLFTKGLKGLPGSLKDNTRFTLILGKDLQDIEIPEKIRFDIIILRTPYLNVKEALFCIDNKVLSIAKLILNRGYRIVETDIK